MESTEVLPHEQSDHDPPVELLLAVADAGSRSLVVSQARARVEALTVLEAEDGISAIQIGLQRGPEIALLDADLTPLGGIAVAVTLRELRPEMRLALNSLQPSLHRELSREYGLPLFSEIGRALGWLEAQARECAGLPAKPRPAVLSGFECSVCGYGVARARPPERCPMCQNEGSWAHVRRPLARPNTDLL